jgi:hypothetical protein
MWKYQKYVQNFAGNVKWFLKNASGTRDVTQKHLPGMSKTVGSIPNTMNKNYHIPSLKWNINLGCESLSTNLFISFKVIP